MTSTPAKPAAGASSEDALVQRLCQGDEDAYRELVVTYSRRLLAVARRFLRNDADAQDALQDAFVSVARAIGTFQKGSSIGTWLHTIVVRTSLMKLRSRRRQEKERPIEDLLPRYHDDGHRANVGPAWPEVESPAEREETRAMVRQCIDQLPESYRVVLMMRDIDGLDTEETATLLGMNVNAVKTRLHRARQALRELLSPHFEALT